MEKRSDARMTAVVEHAMSKLTHECHAEAVQLMTAAGVPVAVISRTLFLPHAIRVRRREARVHGRRYGSILGLTINANSRVFRSANGKIFQK